jgi:hypothetical protein
MGLRIKHARGGIHVIIMAEVVVDEMVMAGGIANLLPQVAVVVDVEERGDVACEKRIATAAVSARDVVRVAVVARDAVQLVVDGRVRIIRTAALVKDVAIRAKNVIPKQRRMVAAAAMVAVVMLKVMERVVPKQKMAKELWGAVRLQKLLPHQS